MALITCTECGEKFSDQAAVCPHCGCPISVVLESIQEQEEKNASPVVASYNILGERFVVTEVLDSGLRLRRVMTDLNHTMKERVAEQYDELNSISAVMDQMPSWMADMTEFLMELGIKFLTTFDVYDYDQQRLFEKYGKLFDTWQIMDPVVEQYLKISDLEDEITAYHDYVAQSRRNTWSGGGFTIGGAIKGQIKAEMLNYGTAFLHSIPDNKNRQQDQERVRQLRQKLYKDGETKKTVIRVFDEAFTRFTYVILGELVQRGLIVVPTQDTSRAKGLIENVLTSEELSPQRKKELCRQAFFADPLYARTIETILLLGMDRSGDVERYAKEYGFYEAFDAHRQEMLKSVFAEEIKKIESFGGVSERYINDAFCDTIHLCAKLMEQGLNMQEQVIQTVDKRGQFSLTEADIPILTASLDAAAPVLGRELVEQEKTKLQAAQQEKEQKARTVAGVVYDDPEELDEVKDEMSILRGCFTGENDLEKLDGFLEALKLNLKTEAGKKEFEDWERRIIDCYQSDWELSDWEPDCGLGCFVAWAVVFFFCARWGIRLWAVHKILSIICYVVAVSFAMRMVESMVESVKEFYKDKNYKRRFEELFYIETINGKETIVPKE
jgi:hypothetical protein